MAVYVDDMRAKFGKLIMCHMVASTTNELHAMADTIGVARRHFQKNHYDICITKKALAIRNGAIAVTQKQLLCLMQQKKQLGKMTTPEEAEAWYREQVRPKN